MTTIVSSLSSFSSEYSNYGFYHLPMDVMQMVMSEWLATEDLARLDSSTLNHNDREAFLGIVQARHFQTPGLIGRDEQVMLSMNYFQWLVLRNIRIRSLALTAPSPSTSSSSSARNILAFSSLLQLRHFVQEIEHLHVDFSSASGRHLSECALHILKRSAQRVQSLTIARSTATDRDLLALIDCAVPSADGNACFPSLTMLDLTAVQGNRFSDSMLIRLIACCPALETLSLAAYSPSPTTSSPSSLDAILIAVANFCPELRALNLDDCLSLSDDGVLALCKPLNNVDTARTIRLEKLSLNRCERVTTSGIVPVLQQAKSLVSLSMAGCGTMVEMDNVLQALVQYNHESLRDLDISYSSSLSQSALVQLMKECVALKRVSANFCGMVTMTGVDGDELKSIVNEKNIDLQVVHIPNSVTRHLDSATKTYS